MSSKGTKIHSTSLGFVPEDGGMEGPSWQTPGRPREPLQVADGSVLGTVLCPQCFEFEEEVVTQDSVAGGHWRSTMGQVDMDKHRHKHSGRELESLTQRGVDHQIALAI